MKSIKYKKKNDFSYNPLRMPSKLWGFQKVFAQRASTMGELGEVFPPREIAKPRLNEN